MKRVVIVGCGSIARTHAKNLKGRVDLRFASRSPVSAELLNRKFSGQGVYHDFESTLADPKVDAVILCTPAQVHFEQASAAIVAGKSVLIEKPAVVSKEQMQQLLELVRELPRGKFLMVGENYYYKPSVARLKQLLASNAIGTLQKILIRKQLVEKTIGWKASCGALLEGGIHFIALMTELAGSSVRRVIADFPTYTAGRPERNSVVSVEFDQGVYGRLQYAWDVPSLTKGLFQHSRLKGSHGEIVFESNGLYLSIHSDEKRRFVRLPLRDITGHLAMVEDFVAALHTTSPAPYATLERVALDMEIVWQAYSQLPGGYV